MEFRKIKYAVVSIIKSILNKVKETLKLPYSKTYLFLSLFLTIIIIIFTFPYDILIRTQLQKLEKNIVKSIFIGDIKTSLFDISTVDNVYITLKNGDEFSLNDMAINASLNPYTLFVSDIFKGDIQINSVKFSSPTIQVNCNVNGNIALEIDKESGLPIDGFIKIILQNATLKLDEITLPSSMGGMPIKIPILKFTSVNLDSKVSGEKIIIKNIKVSGPDIRGTIKGSIVTANFIRNWRLNLNITIDSESKALEEYKDFLTQYIDKNGKITFPLSGTISHPRTKLNRKLK